MYLIALTCIIHSFSCYDLKLLTIFENPDNNRGTLRFSSRYSIRTARLIAALLKKSGTLSSHDQKRMNYPG